MPQVKAEIKRLRRLLKSCLDCIYPQIDGLLRNGLLVDIAAEFHSLDLITESTKDEPSYNKISRELKIRIDILRTQEDLEKHCLDIIVVFESKRGPLVDAAKELEDLWIEKTREQGFAFTVRKCAIQETIPYDGDLKPQFQKSLQLGVYNQQHVGQSPEMRIVSLLQSLQSIYNNVMEKNENTKSSGDEAAVPYAESSEASSETKKGASWVVKPEHIPPTLPSDIMDRTDVHTTMDKKYPRTELYSTDDSSHYDYDTPPLSITQTQLSPTHENNGKPDSAVEGDEIADVKMKEHCLEPLLEQPSPSNPPESPLGSTNSNRKHSKQRTSVTSFASNRSSSFDRFSNRSASQVNMPVMQDDKGVLVFNTPSTGATTFADIQDRLYRLEQICNPQIHDELLEKETCVNELEKKLKEKEIQLEERGALLQEVKRERDRQLEGLRKNRDEQLQDLRKLMEQEKDAQIQEMHYQLQELRKDRNAQLQEARKERDDQLKECKEEKNALIQTLRTEKESLQQQLKQYENHVTLSTKELFLLVIVTVGFVFLAFVLNKIL